MGGPGRVFVALGLVLEAVAAVSVQRERLHAPAARGRLDQSRSPAVADIIGARRACTVCSADTGSTVA